jgi:hypothetical protein
MRYTEGVYKRNRNGKLVYDGVLAYYDERGKRKFAHRERKTQSAAREALRKLRNELEDRGPKALEKNVVSFVQLADYCEKEIYVQAEYNSAGEKLFGVRNASAYKAHLKHFRDFFGARKLKDISIADVKDIVPIDCALLVAARTAPELTLLPPRPPANYKPCGRCCMKPNVTSGSNKIHLSLPARTK